jgi:hypothetical protein
LSALAALGGDRALAACPDNDPAAPLQFVMRLPWVLAVAIQSKMLLSQDFLRPPCGPRPCS